MATPNSPRAHTKHSAERPKINTLHIQKFGTLNTQITRQAIAENQFSWLENIMPIGDGTLSTVPGRSTSIADLGALGETIYYWYTGQISGINYVVMICNSGSVYAFDTANYLLVKLANNALSSGGASCVQWKNERLLFIDPVKGYFTVTNSSDWTLLDSTKVGTVIEVYSGRVWIGNKRTVLFSAPNSYTDFSAINTGGSFIMTDPSLHAGITSLKSANGTLYVFGESSVNAISNVQVVTPTQVGGTGNAFTSFNNLPILTEIGCPFPRSAVLTYNRELMFQTMGSIYAINGVNPKKISGAIDGITPYIDTAYPVTSGTAVINSIQCAAYMFTYNPKLAIAPTAIPNATATPVPTVVKMLLPFDTDANNTSSFTFSPPVLQPAAVASFGQNPAGSLGSGCVKVGGGTFKVDTFIYPALIYAANANMMFQVPTNPFSISFSIAMPPIYTFTAIPFVIGKNDIVFAQVTVSTFDPQVATSNLYQVYFQVLGVFSNTWYNVKISPIGSNTLTNLMFAFDGTNLRLFVDGIVNSTVVPYTAGYVHWGGVSAPETYVGGWYNDVVTGGLQGYHPLASNYDYYLDELVFAVYPPATDCIPVASFTLPTQGLTTIVKAPIVLEQYGEKRNLMAVFFDGKFFLASQGDELTMCLTSLNVSGQPLMFGTDGKKIYKLFDNVDANVKWRYSTKLHDLGVAYIDKHQLKVGLEVFGSGPYDIQVDNEYNGYVMAGCSPVENTSGDWINAAGVLGLWENAQYCTTGHWTSDLQYYLIMRDILNIGKYIGVTVTSNSQAKVVGNIMQLITGATY
jgi:hypothetical protein